MLSWKDKDIYVSLTLVQGIVVAEGQRFKLQLMDGGGGVVYCKTHPEYKT